MYAAYGVKSDRVISISDSCTRRFSALSSQPTTRPIATPPIATSTKSTAAPPSENVPAVTAPTAERYRVGPTASFTTPSPSTTPATRSGTGVRRNTAVAATGSVGASTAPRTNAIGHDSSPSTTRATAATATTVSTTSATASSAMRPALAFRSRGELVNAAAYSSGGRKTRKTMSGSRRSRGMPGTRAIARPPSTRNTGYGTCRRPASCASSAIARSSSMRNSMSCTAPGLPVPGRGGARCSVPWHAALHRHAQAPEPAGGDHGLVRRAARLDRRERRAARDRRRSRRRPRRPAVGRQLLPACPRLAHPRGREARRRVRRAARVLARRGRLRGDVAAVRAGPVYRGARRRTGAAGHVRRAIDAERARVARRAVHAQRPRRGDRGVDGVDRDRGGRRAARRRRDHRRRLVALDLRDQHPVRDRDAGADRDRGARPDARRETPVGRLARRRALRARAGGAGVRADPPARRRVGRAERRHPDARRVRALRPLPPARGDHGRADAAALALPTAELRGRQRRDLHHVRRAVGALLLPDPVPAAGRRVERAEGRARDAPDDRRHVRPVAPHRPARRPVRAAYLHGRRPARRRGRAPAGAACRRRSRLRDRPAAGAARLRYRSVVDGRAAHRDRAGR